MQQKQLSVPLSRLVPNRKNPRRVRPARESHKRLVALIRSMGLIHPLVVRPHPEQSKYYLVVAGSRRLAALREIHRGDGDPKIDCVLRDVDAGEADSLALAENFGREAMHPLDEAEAFSKLALGEGKSVDIIGAEFGVGERYVRQRMVLAELIPEVKAAYREWAIDTATAEAFASVPTDRQREVWQETGGKPRHADHVRNIIANAWIDAGHALFDVATLPDGVVSRDLFSERVLVERSAFMEAQTQALAKERDAMVEDGWASVVAGPLLEVHGQMAGLVVPEREFDEKTERRLGKLAARREQLEKQFEGIDDGDGAAFEAVSAKIERLDGLAQDIANEVPEFHSEATKAVGSAFLILDPDGQVRREYRIPRRASHSRNGSDNAAMGEGTAQQPMPPTSEKLSDRQLATTFAHQTIAVREALLRHERAKKCVLALLLHDKVRSEALAVRHDANGVTLHATGGDGFSSVVFDQLIERQAKHDPFREAHFVDDRDGYDSLSKLSPAKLDALIDSLVVASLTAHPLQKTALVFHLMNELRVDVRASWRPGAMWLAGYQKGQLAHLMAELFGPVYSPTHEKRKKSEMVDALATLFSDAADGKLEDKKLADRVNRWLPSNLRDEPAT